MGLVAAVLWGSQYPIAKSVYDRLDPYTLTAARYVVAVPVFLLILAVREGRRALSYDGRVARLTALGVVGFAGGALLPFVGLQFTSTQSAALVGALQPLLMAIVLAARGSERLGRFTVAMVLVAFFGVLMVVTRGDPAALVDGRVGWGAALVLVGQLAWVVYSISVTSVPGWSPLRFTALTALPGGIAILLVAVAAAAVGATHPTAGAVTSSALLLAYLTAGPAVTAVLAWNAGRARIGAGNIALFHNLVPVTAFAIVIAGGYRPNAAEALGAVLTIGALVANDLARRSSGRR